MNEIKNDTSCFLCHIYEIDEAMEAGRDLEIAVVKDYSSERLAVDKDKLHRHLNILYAAPVAERELVRCRKCGALMIYQSICDPNIYDGFEYLDDWIPACSEEEADRLNSQLDTVDLSTYPVRHLRRMDFKVYKWTGGEKPRTKNDETEVTEGAE